MAGEPWERTAETLRTRLVFGIHAALMLGSLVACVALALASSYGLSLIAGVVGVVTGAFWRWVTPRNPVLGATGIIITTNSALIAAAYVAGSAVTPACYTVLTLPTLLLPWGRPLAVAVAASWTSAVVVSIPGLLVARDVSPVLLAVHFATMPIVAGAMLWFARVMSKGNRDLSAARDRAQHADRLKTELVARASHELRTPLAAMIGFLGRATRHLDTRELVAEDLAVATRNAHGLLAIVNDLLEVSTVKQKLEMERTAISPLLSEVVEVATVLAYGRPITLRCELAETGIPAELDTQPHALRQILINLLGNAVKFCESGEVRLHCALHGAGAQRCLQISVSDTGRGIPEDVRDRIFEPFFRSHEAKVVLGTGLGLSVARQLAQDLGGELALMSSELGRGSTFMLTLPVPHQPNEVYIQHLAPVEYPSESEVAVDLGGLCCLVADDNPDLAELVREVLTHHGAVVTVVHDGESAIKQAREAAVVFMDIDMPKIDGLAAIRALRTHGYPGALIAITAHQIKTRCLEAGADQFLSKPVTVAKVLAAASQYVADENWQTENSTLGQTLTIMRKRYAAKLPDKVEQLAAALEHGGDEPARLLHSLAGTAGSYGFDTLSQVAGELRAVLTTGDERERDALIERLRTLAQQALPHEQ